MILPLAHWSIQLRALLQSIEPLGSFVYAQHLTDVPLLLPRITVHDVGRLGFPIADVSVRQLIASSAKAPYGKMDQTLMDTKVRDAWQIDADRITISKSDQWTEYFTKIVRQNCFHLGVSSERFETLGIQANLYKMLIYEKDGHFLTHRDTEKEPHMFGTLLFQLPTSDGFQGGELTVSHRGVTKTINLSENSDDAFHTVAFYADCVHELYPITNGTRVCLVYNLVATLAESNKNVTIPSNDINTETEIKLRSICETWCASDLKEITKIGYQLGHEYTRQSICFSTLKGRDEIIATTLRNAKNAKGERLFGVSILLMELLSSENRYFDLDETSTKPYIVINEADNGLWERTHVEIDWDMDCYSENGWWVMTNDELTDMFGYDEEKEAYTSDEMCELEPDKQMFQFPCDTIKEVNPYNGNDGGDVETFYYAAAIIICPSNV